jgi:small subunit ribosomal protein S7e
MEPKKKKVRKQDKSEITLLEKQVATHLIELESSVKDLVKVLRDTYIHAAKLIQFQQMGKKKEAIVIFLPCPVHRKIIKHLSRIIRELEKKCSGKYVIFVAQRTILSKKFGSVRKGMNRPRSRTLTNVHQAILRDVVFPTEIVGKRTRVRVDGSKILKIHLDPKDAKEVDVKLAAFSAVYKKLTNRSVTFMFPPEN